MPSLTNGVDKKVEVCWQLSFYGALMTKRQREMLQLYFEDDLSLGEIAKTAEVSRQCVHNTIHRAVLQLSDLENKLGLVMRFRQLQSIMTLCRQDLDFVEATEETKIHLTKVKNDLKEMIANEEI